MGKWDKYEVAPSKWEKFEAEPSNKWDKYESEPERPSLSKLFGEGLRESTPAMLAKLAGADIDEPSVEPKGFLENIAYGAGEYLPDIATLPLGTGLAGILGKGALKTAGKQILKTGTKKALKKKAKGMLAKEVAGLTAEELAKKGGKRALIKALPRAELQAVKPAFKDAAKAIPKFVKAQALEGASIGGVAEAVHSPLKQYTKTGKVSPGQTVKDIALAAGAGAVGDVALMPVAQAAKGIMKGIKKPFKTPKGIDPKRLDNIIAEAGVERDIAQQTIKSGQGKISPELKEIVDMVKEEIPLINTKETLSGSERNILSESAGRRLEDFLVRKKLREAGHAPEMMKDPAENIASKLLNATENFDRIEQATGVRVGSIPRKAYEAASEGSNYMATRGREILDLKNKFKGVEGAKLGKILEQSDITKLSPSEQQIKQSVGDVFLSMRKDAIDKGLDVGLIEHYLPRRLKVFLSQRTETGARFGVPLLDSPLEYKRLAREATSPLYEKDAWKLLNRYAREVSRIDMMKKILPDVKQKVTLLRGMGKNASAEAVEKTFAKGAGLEHRAVQKFMAEDFVNGQLPNVDQLVKMLPVMKKDKAQTFVNEVTKLMYNSWIGLNPRTLVKQVMQNRLVGSAELGTTWIERGARAKGKYKKLLDEISPSLYADSLDFIEQEGWRQEATGGLRKALDLLIIPSKPGMKAFTGLDKSNRRAAFLSGYLKAKKKGFGDEVLDHLLPSQKRDVLETVEREGIEAAAKLFGKISSHRINYLYSVFDKPGILQNELGKFIPFTTWGRNQINRFYGDLANTSTKTSAKQLAKRAVLPLMYLGVFEAITGYQIPGAHPIASIPSTADISAVPALTRPLMTAAQGKGKQALKEALSVLPPARAIQQGTKILSPTKRQKKQTPSTLARLLGLKKGGK